MGERRTGQNGKKYIVGIDLGGTNIKAGLFDEHFTALEELSIPTEAQLGPAHVLERIRLAVTQLCAGSGTYESQIACMGMGIPGLLDPEEGLSVFFTEFSRLGAGPCGQRNEAVLQLRCLHR
ncbi:ROK family protein [Paenibacillus rhizoplanae]